MIPTSTGRLSPPVTAALLVLLAAALFGTITPLSRPVYAAGVTPFAFVAWRIGWGAVFMSVFVLGRSRSTRAGLGLERMTGRTLVLLAVAIGFEALVNLAVFAALTRTTIAVVLFVLYTFPAIVTAILVVLGRERLDRIRLAALALAIVGVIGVMGGGNGTAASLRLDPLGIGLAFLAAVSQAAFIVLTREGFGGVPANTSTAVVMIGTALVSVAATIVADGLAALTLPLGDRPLLALLVSMGVFASAVPFFLFVSGIRRLGGIRTGILMLFEPVVAVSLAAIFLHEAVAPAQVVGGVVVLLAAALVQRRSGPARVEALREDEPAEIDEAAAAGRAGLP